MTGDPEPKESVLGILRSAINIEKFGIRYYRAVSNVLEDRGGKELLNYLAEIESDHQRLLEQEYDKQKELGSEAVKSLPLDNLDDQGNEIIFSEPLEYYEPENVTAVDAVKFGINVEQRSIDFYSSAAKIMNDLLLKETFNKLVDFEKEHLELLNKTLESLEKDGSWYTFKGL